MDYLYKLLEEQEDKENIDYVTENKDVVKIIQKVYKEKGEGIYCIFYCQLNGKLCRFVFTREEFVEILGSKKYLECKKKVDNIPERDDINEVVYLNLGTNTLIPYLYSIRILNTIDSFGTCVFLLTDSRELKHKSALDIYRDKSVVMSKCDDDQITVYENVSLLIQTKAPLPVQEKANINNILSFLEPKNQLKAKLALNNYGVIVPNKVNYKKYMTLTDEEKEQVSILNCSNSKLEQLPKLPKGLKRLICNHNYIQNYENLPENLIEFDCSGDYGVTKISLPKKLEIFKCYHCLHLEELPELPETLVELDCSECSDLKELPELPGSLLKLKIQDMRLTHFPKLPPNLKVLDCSFGVLKSLPELPPKLEVLKCHANEIKAISKLPDTLIELRCDKATRLPKKLPGSLLKLKILDEDDSDEDSEDEKSREDSEDEKSREEERSFNAILEEIKKRANYTVDEKWVFECEDGHYFGMKTNIIYTGNKEACFLQIRKNCLKETGIDLLEGRIDFLNAEEIIENVGKDVDLIFEDLLDDDDQYIWMKKIKYKKSQKNESLLYKDLPKYNTPPKGNRETPFEAFCSQYDKGESLDVLIDKWDSLPDKERNKFFNSI